MPLKNAQSRRFSCQILLPQIGKSGQEKLLRSKVLVVGCGALGGSVAHYLVANGVGEVGLVDNSKIFEAQLPRQPFFYETEIGKFKIDILKKKLTSHYKTCKINLIKDRMTPQDARKILKPYDIVVEATDNFPSRYVVNDACVSLKKPFVSLSVFQWEGLVSLFGLEDGPCFRCLYPHSPSDQNTSTCDEAGVLGTLPGLLASIGSSEVIKYLLAQGITLKGRLLLTNSLEMSFQEVKLEKNPRCPSCARTMTNISSSDLVHEFESLSESDLGHSGNPFFISPKDLKQTMKKSKRLLIIDVRDANELEVAQFPGAEHVPFGDLEKFIKSRLASREFEELVIVSHRGNKGLRALAILNRHNVPNVRVLAGGIDRWAVEVDSKINRY